MAFQKFIAWENLPSLIAKPDAVESSSSSSESENASIYEPEKELNVKLKDTIVKPEIGPHPKIEIPPSVKNVLDKLDLGQLERAKKDVSKKLGRILDNVNRTYEHYRKDDGIDPQMEKEYYFSQTWEERNRRTHFLDVIADVLDESKFKIQELQMVLESFKNTHESLKTIDLREKGTSYDDMIDDMEEHLLKFINSIDNNVQRLIKLFYPLVKEKIKPRRKSTLRSSMFKAWCDKVAENPKEGEPLTPERMLEDEHLTLTHCNDVVLMTQEMVDSPLFNRIEHDVIKYIAVMVANLTKAFNLLNKQHRGLKIKCESLAALDTRKQDPQVGHLQRELRAALDKKAALEMQVHAVEEQCKILLITNETMQKELQDANERAMTMGKVSFPKLPLSKTPEKVPLDAEKEVKSKKEEKSPVVPPSPPVKLPSAKPDKKEKHVEMSSGELGERRNVRITIPEKEGHLPPHSVSTQEGGIKLGEKDQEKDQFPEAVVAADISFDKPQPDIAQKSQKEKAPLEERAPETPKEKSLPEKKAQKTEKQKAPLEEGAPETPEEKSIPEKKAQKTEKEKEKAPLEERSETPEEKSLPEEKAQKTEQEKAPLEEGAPETPEEKSLPEKKAQKTEKEKASLEEKGPESPEEEAALEEETPLIDTTKEDGQALEKQLLSEEKGQVPRSKQKTTKVPRRPSKLSKWKNVQTSLLKQPTKPRDEARLSQPSVENVIVSDDTSMMQLSTVHDTAVTQPAIPDDKSVTHPAIFDHTVVTQPATLDDIAVAQPEMLDDTMVTKSTSLQDTEESLQEASVGSPPKPGAEEDTPSTSPEGELPLPRRQSTLDTSAPSEKTHGKRKTSLKLTAGKVVETIKEKKLVKFSGDSMVQKISESQETLSTQSLVSPQAGTAEGAEDSATDTQHTGTVQPQKRLAGKVKEIHEKKDTKRTGKMTASVPQSKQAEKIENVLHNLGIKLQDIARDRGGVIEAETIKEIFEELSITYHDTARGRMGGSHPIDKPGKGSPARRPSLLSPAAEHTPRKEGQKSLEDVSSVQDVNSALQEFQGAILACLEDKLDKARKGSPDAHKQSVKFQSRDPQVQQLFQAIDKKLEEYTSMKLKILTGVKKHKMMSSVQSKEDTLEGEEREVRVITSSFYDTLSVEGRSFSSSSFSFSRTESEEQTTSGEDSQLMAWEEKEEEFDYEVEKEIKGEEEVKEKKQEEEQEMKQVVEQERRQKKMQGQLKKLKEEAKYQRERISSLGGQMAKLEEEEDEDEDIDQMSPPQEEKPSLEHLPFERPLQARVPWWDRKKQRIQQTFDEQYIRWRKESKPVSESDEGKELWKEQLQEETEQLQEETERLQGEKERLQEELRRLQEERQRLEEEEKQLEQWKQMFEQQQLQWEFEQQRHKEQEHLWQAQLQQWEQLQQQNEEQTQHWSANREQQKEQQRHLQEEIEQLQEEYREYLKMRGEQAEEQWRWRQLRSWHQEQEAIWQKEEQEHKQNRVQWQEQLAQHQEQIESLRREQEKQEQEMKKWQQERQEKQDGLQKLWEKWWQQQLESWHRQMHRQRAQHHKWQEHSNQLQEKQQQQMSKEVKSLTPQLKVVEGSALDPFSKHYRTSPTSKERRPSTTPQITPIPSGELEEDTLELETTWFPKLFSKAVDLPAPDVTEKRYLLNVEGQRKNLELLKEAAQNADVSPELYTKTKSIISQALHTNVERLALLLQKYKTLHLLQEARRSLTIKLDAAKDIKDGSEMQNLYKMVGNLDAYQKKVLDNWTVKQNAVEKKRRRCIEKMAPLFAQIRMSTKLRLSDPRPLMVRAGDRTKKEILHMPQIGSVFLKPKVGKSPLISVKKPTDFTFSAVVREPSSEQLESLWKTDITELSIPLGPKTPVSVLWSEAYGFPDIPRLLELDISSIRKKPLQTLKTRIQNIPRWKISGYNFMHL